jgi:hypothetical protein
VIALVFDLIFEYSSFLSPKYLTGDKDRVFNTQHTPVEMAVESVCYIADHLKSAEDDDKVE